MIKKLKIVIAALLYVAIVPTGAQAQRMVKGYELTEIVKLAESYRNAPYLNYSYIYTYADSAHPGTVLEQMSGATFVSGGNYYTVIDSVELIQGNTFRLAVYYRDSTIVASDRQQYGDLFQMPILDPDFLKANVDSMEVTDIGSGLWELKIAFKPSSGYGTYKFQYNNENYRMTKMEYYLRNVPDTSGLVNMTALITLEVSDYSTAPFDLSIFNEDKYIYRSSGLLLKRPPYQNFALINNTSN